MSFSSSSSSCLVSSWLLRLQTSKNEGCYCWQCWLRNPPSPRTPPIPSNGVHVMCMLSTPFCKVDVGSGLLSEPHICVNSVLTFEVVHHASRVPTRCAAATAASSSSTLPWLCFDSPFLFQKSQLSNKKTCLLLFVRPLLLKKRLCLPLFTFNFFLMSILDTWAERLAASSNPDLTW